MEKRFSMPKLTFFVGLLRLAVLAHQSLSDALPQVVQVHNHARETGTAAESTRRNGKQNFDLAFENN